MAPQPESTAKQTPACKVCGKALERVRRITLPNGVKIVRYETRAIYCSSACCQRAYRARKAFDHARLTPPSA